MFLRTLLILAAAVLPLFGQVGAVLDGTVQDDTAAVIPSAGLILRNVATGETRTGTASAEGYFRFVELRPGQYNLTVKASGFTELSLDNLELTIGQHMTVRPVLRVGGVAEKIEVVATPPPVTTSSSSIAHLVDSRRIEELPLNGRNPLQLVSLVPGVIGAGEAGQFGVRQSTFRVNGGRASDMNFSLDGGINMNSYYSIASEYPNPDALQEFSVNTRTYSATLSTGTSSVAAITRSGTNEFHGAAFEFLRNTSLDARSFFAAERPDFKRNQFGATLGGPVARNRTFFFASYQGTIQRGSPGERRYRSLTAAERRGDFSASTKVLRDPLSNNQPFAGNVIPTARIHPFAAKVVERDLPMPNSGEFYGFTVAEELDQTQIIGKIDHNWSEADRTSFRYMINEIPQRGIGGNSIPSNEFLVDFPTRLQSFNLGHTRLLSSTALLDVRLTHMRNAFGVRHPRKFSFKELGLAINEDNSIGEYGLTPQSHLLVNGYFNIQQPVPARDISPSTHLQATLTWNRGKHSLQFGFEVYKNRLNELANWLTGGQMRFSGQASGDAAADFLLGRFLNYRQISPTIARLHQTLPSWYVQDDLKLSRRVTLNLGVRWDPGFGWTSENDAMSAFIPGVQSERFPKMAPGLLYPGDSGLPDGIAATRWNNIAPRVGLAWDVFGTGNTSVRAGFGIYYVTQRAGINLNRFPLIQPFTADVTIDSGDVNNIFARAPFNGRNPFPTPAIESLEALRAAEFVPTMSHTSFGLPFKTPSDRQWSFSIQQALGSRTSIEAAYVGSSSSHMFTGLERNYARYIPGQSTAGNIQSRRLFPQFGPISEVRNVLSSNHNALQLTLNKRYSKGFTVLSSYTWGKSLGVASGTGEGSVGPRNPEDFRADYGRLGGDIRHNFIASFLWEIPFGGKGAPAWQRWMIGGWQIGGINSLRSGDPFTVRAGRDNSLVGTNSDTADLVGEWRLPGGRSREEKILQYFNTAAFVQGPQGTFGNLGLNNLEAPGTWNLDLVASKRARLSESRSLEFRASFYNALNNVNLGNPNASLNSPTFGRITGAGVPRVIELGIRFAY